jgi:hypothetical protein
MKYILIALLLIGCDDLNKPYNHYGSADRLQDVGTNDSLKAVIYGLEDSIHKLRDSILAHNYSKKDTVKWKPYYVKKKNYHYGTGYIPFGGRLPDTLRNTKIDSEFNGMGIRGKEKWGGKLLSDTMFMSSLYRLAKIDSDRMLESFRPVYPWWKKLLWVLLGIFISAVVIVIAELASKPNVDSGESYFK